MCVTPRQGDAEGESKTLCCELLPDALSVLMVNYHHTMPWVIN